MKNESQKTNKNKKLLIIFLVIGLLLATGVIFGFVFQDNIKTIAMNIKTDIENRGKPKFIFNTEQFSDWATVGNEWPEPNDDTIGDVPVASISVHQCTEGIKCQSFIDECESGKQCEKLGEAINGRCFVMAFYQNGTINPEEVLAKTAKQNRDWGMDVQEVGVKTLSMNTPEGDKEYILHKYNNDSKSDEAMYRGNAQGYILLSDGYIDVRGVCAEVGQLDEILPILSGIRLSV